MYNVCSVDLTYISHNEMDSNTTDVVHQIPNYLRSSINIDSDHDRPSLMRFESFNSKTSKPRDGSISIRTMLQQQKDVIRFLTYAPSFLVDYIHYRGSKPVEFTGINLPIPSIPLIPYNDGQFCCLLDKISGSDDTHNACRNLDVKPLGPRGKIGVPYIINDTEGTELVVKLTKIDKLYSIYRSSPPTSLDFLIGKRNEIRHCMSDIELRNIRYIASDEFTNETLIAYVLNYLSTLTSLPPLFVRHYQGAICVSSSGEMYGLNIMENCDLGSLDKVTSHSKFSQYMGEYDIEDNGRTFRTLLVSSEVIRQILTQITVGLHMLQSNVNFISGDLKAGNVFLKSESIDTQYLGVKLHSSFTCKIADYGKSSCMLYKSKKVGIRFYNDSTLANAYLSFHPFEDDIYTEDGEYFYTISPLFIAQIYTRTRHMGIPFYLSFDYYTLIVSMLTNPRFYYMFFGNELLRTTFWNPIWKHDGPEAMNRIHQYVLEGTGQSLNDSITILRGLRLKCNAVHIILTKLRSLDSS